MNINNHGMVPCKIKIDHKSKMSASPIGKIFKNYSYLKPLTHLTASFAGMYLDVSEQNVCFCVDRKSKMSATAVHS